MVLIRVENLTKEFNVNLRIGKKAKIRAVDNVSLEIMKGETLGLIGESGCGKTTFGRMLVKLISPTSGRIIYNGVDITNMREKEFRPYRKRVQIVFQDPFSSLNPRMTVFDILRRPLEIHKVIGKNNPREYIAKILEEVGLREEHMLRFPHEFSGGQRQRISIARALVLQPEFIVLDEPTSALDVSVQSQILNLLKDLKKSRNLTYLFISHDLSVIRYMSDRIAVMYMGEIVELAKADELFENPFHPYTKMLMDSIPIPNPSIRKSFSMIKGELPSLLNPPKGCRFSTRCDFRVKECETKHPDLIEVKKGHFVRCLRINK